MSHIGSVSELVKIKSQSGTKIRYYCPFCVTAHNKTPDLSGCFVYDTAKLTGYCFRCHSQVIHDGLRDLDLLANKLKGDTLEEEYKKAQNQKLRLEGWTTPIIENTEALLYMKKRGFSFSTLDRFKIRACNEPSLGVVFANRIFDEGYTDFYQVRYKSFKYRHAMLGNLIKKACWLNYADTPRLVLVEGFSSGLAAYEHSCKWKQDYLNPVICCGNSLTEIQLRELKEYCDKFNQVKIYICLDGGFFEYALKIAKKIYERCNNVELLLTHLTGSSDPNDLEYWEFLQRLDSSYYYEPNRVQYIRKRAYV